MKTLNPPYLLAAVCAGLLVSSASWGGGPGAAHDIRVEKGDTLSDSAWQRRRDSTKPRMAVGISGGNSEIFPGNLGEERADERGAFRANRQPGGWYQHGRDQQVPVLSAPEPVMPSPRAP
jgi:hypothetical protein